MKKYVGLLALTSLIGSMPFAQNLVYDANAQVRKVGSFNGVEVSNGIVLYLSQGSTQAVAVSANDDRYIDKIITTVEKGVLIIKLENGLWNSFSWGNKKIKAYVTCTELTSLGVSGGSIAKIQDQIKVRNISMDASGGSIIEGNIQGTSMDADLSGGSIYKLSGSMDLLKLELSGGSIFKDYSFSVNTCDLDASGGSISNFTLNKTLKAEASGGSIINYKGDGNISSVDVSGGSIIKKKE
ncbi:MAG: DUF2807 domain-containing protein [Bacteroidetes bacterium]|nr:DUF2807 domain-containing protein [Bacteroidota bacterium]